MALHAALPGGAVGVDYAGVVEVLLDVAHAVQYLHSMHLMHGDIKVSGGVERLVVRWYQCRGSGRRWWVAVCV